MIRLGLAFIITVMISSTAVAKINWSIYRSNSFLWGQIVGCLIRFEVYIDATSSADQPVNKEAVGNMVYSILGDVTDHKRKMYEFGMGPNHLGNMTIPQFESFISNIAVKETKNNMSWLQTLSCAKMLKDHEFTTY